MARFVLGALVALALATGAYADLKTVPTLNATQAAAVTLASISPPQMSVTLKFNITTNDSPTTACNVQKLHSECLPKVHADSADKVFITYNLANASALAVAPASIMLKACYSNDSQIDRPWRKTSPIISKSKKCPIVIAKGLPTTAPAGGVPFAPKETTALAAYFVRAFLMHNSSATVTYPVAFGASTGYFQIDPIDSRPRNMKIACGICACVGPIMFLVYFTITRIRKKQV